MNFARRALSRLIGWLRFAVTAKSGVAAVEFAMIAPFMVLTYMGVVDITRGVIANRKLDVLSRTVSDLVSQQPTNTSISSSSISTIFTAATALMQPFDTTGLTLTVSAVDIKRKSNNTCCDALVRWSYTKGGTLRACTTPLTQVANGAPATSANIPAALITANQTAGYGYTTGSTSYIIISDAKYTYVPFFYRAVNWFSPGMGKTTYMVPRSASGTVALSTPVNAASGQSGVVCF